MLSSFKTFLLFVLVGFIGLAQTSEKNQKLNLDESVRTGVLKNGMTYYIKKNQKPENEVTFDSWSKPVLFLKPKNNSVWHILWNT